MPSSVSTVSKSWKWAAPHSQNWHWATDAREPLGRHWSCHTEARTVGLHQGAHSTRSLGTNLSPRRGLLQVPHISIYSQDDRSVEEHPVYTVTINFAETSVSVCDPGESALWWRCHSTKRHQPQAQFFHWSKTSSPPRYQNHRLHNCYLAFFALICFNAGNWNHLLYLVFTLYALPKTCTDHAFMLVPKVFNKNHSFCTDF